MIPIEELLVVHQGLVGLCEPFLHVHVLLHVVQVLIVLRMTHHLGKLNALLHDLLMFLLYLILGEEMPVGRTVDGGAREGQADFGQQEFVRLGGLDVVPAVDRGVLSLSRDGGRFEFTLGEIVQLGRHAVVVGISLSNEDRGAFIQLALFQQSLERMDLVNRLVVYVGGLCLILGWHVGSTSAI